jgi:hypothetical protein
MHWNASTTSRRGNTSDSVRTLSGVLRDLSLGLCLPHWDVIGVVVSNLSSSL